MVYIENKVFDEIQIGDSASLQHNLIEHDIETFAAMSGDVNPTLLDKEFAKQDRYHERIAPGMFGGALISTVLGTKLPGLGTISVSQSLRFVRPVMLGDKITVTVTVLQKDPTNHHVTLDCSCFNQRDELVIQGQAEVIAPSIKSRLPAPAAKEIMLRNPEDGYAQFMNLARDLAPIPTAVVHPCDRESLQGAMDAFERKLIIPLLVGPASKLEAVAKEIGISLQGVEVVDAPHSHAAAVRAVELVRAGRAEALMKGSLHTDELLSATLDRANGLRTASRLSHIFLAVVPAYHKILMITDAAINIAPDLDCKRDILLNAIQLAHALGITTPKVGILSAVETINPKMLSTLDAAALCKMADRGQISGAILDGPLAFDNAISAEAAATKKITSPVAGDVDILLAPDLEAGNMLAKQLDYLANADMAGIVLGARVPIILTSRAEKAPARVASCAVAAIYAHWLRKQAVAACTP